MQEKHGSVVAGKVAALQAVLITMNETAKEPVATLINMAAKSESKTSPVPKKKARLSKGSA